MHLYDSYLAKSLILFIVISFRCHLQPIAKTNDPFQTTFKGIMFNMMQVDYDPEWKAD